ncbi:MAG: hypothetical protein U0X20_03375 [Caldilineaceae bacterium]
MMGPAPGIGERLLALEVAVAALQTEVRALAGAGAPAPAPAVTELEKLAQQLGNARLAAVLVRAGYTSVEAVAAAPDEALLAVDGVGEKALKAIRAKVG